MRKTQPAILCFKDEGRDGTTSQGMWWLPEVGKGKKTKLSTKIQEGTQPCPVKPCLTFDLQNYKITNVCCLKPLNLCSDVIAVVEDFGI